MKTQLTIIKYRDSSDIYALIEYEETICGVVFLKALKESLRFFTELRKGGKIKRHHEILIDTNNINRLKRFIKEVERR